jgi:cyclohexanone monooxygenase
MTQTQSCDVVVVGAGFAGLYMLHRLRQAGQSARLFEAGPSVGGTWFWNRYPGARVDIESQEYCYTFSPELYDEWKWTERYAAQPELLAYLNHVADRFGLRDDIQLETRVTSAGWDEASRRWTVTTDRDDEVRSRYVVMATGCLSIPKDIDIPGEADFDGPTYHTSRWPEGEVDFTGKRVAVIGTGSSGIQVIPEIARQAEHLYVFQRTPNFTTPARNHATDPALVEDWRVNRDAYRAEARNTGLGVRSPTASAELALAMPPERRRREYEERWAYGGALALYGACLDLLVDKAANDTVAEFVREQIRGVVTDPAVAEKLAPKSYPIGGKRICVDTGYYATFNRDNVSLVDLTETPIERVTPGGVKTSAREYEVDAIVYAIGFDAMTGALDKIDIRGNGGARLKDAWAGGPGTYLGLMVAGFPNLFLVTGPGSPSVLSNMALAIEQHVEWISDCIGWMGARQAGAIEATAAAQNAWVAQVNEIGDATLFPLANSWYVGANVPGKPRVFMPYFGGFPAYLEKCNEVAAAGYDGCVVSA